MVVVWTRPEPLIGRSEERAVHYFLTGVRDETELALLPASGCTG
jgi:hypothetical protein